MPTPAGYSVNGMPTFKGQAPGLNANGQISNIAWTRYYKLVTTATATLTAAMSGAVVLLQATANTTITLPSIATGPFDFEIISLVAFDSIIASVVTDTIIGFNDVDLDSVSITASGSEIGAHYQVHCDGTNLIVLNILASTYQAIVTND